MGNINKLMGIETPLEIGQKINEIIENGTGINNKITNCLLEVPQRIKYDLTDGTLTVKAGSVVIVPYGVEDKTSEYPIGSTFLNDNFKVVDTQYFEGKFFVWVEIQSDITTSSTTTTSGKIRHMFIHLTTNVVFGHLYNGSGSEDYTGTGNYTLYHTVENIVKCWTDGSIIDRITSLPVCLVIDDGAHICGSIKQVFNGFGYIGSTIWADKGVKCLIPNGKNADGTLKNIEYTLDTVKSFAYNYAIKDYPMYIQNGNFGADSNITFFEDKLEIVLPTKYQRAYVSSENQWYTRTANSTTWNKSNICLLGVCDKGTDGTVNYIQPKLPFRAVDYNEFAKLDELPHIVETYKNGGSWYRVWSDGWCEQGGVITFNSTRDPGGKTITFLRSFIDTEYYINLCTSKMAGGTFGTSYADKTTESCWLWTFGHGADDKTNGFLWEAKGYIK